MGVANTDVTNVHICEETTRFDDEATEENDICEQTQVGLDIAQIHQNNSLFGYTWISVWFCNYVKWELNVQPTCFFNQKHNGKLDMMATDPNAWKPKLKQTCNTDVLIVSKVFWIVTR